MVEVNDNKVLFLAIWLHETYESQAREVGWKTQESCRVKFDDLPEANKKVMLKIARDIVYNLEINKQEGRVEGAIAFAKKIDFIIEEQVKRTDSVRLSLIDSKVKELIRKDYYEKKRLKELEKKVLNNEFCD